MKRLTLYLAALAAAFALALPAAAQPLPPGEKAMEVRLAAETPEPIPGRSVTLAVLMEPRPGWHGYWQNPGDAGRAPRIAWQLPRGVTAGPLRYPVPQRLVIGGLVNYVYEGRYALLADLTLPDLPYGTRLPIRATFDYLVCTDEVCVPESATVSVELTIGAGRLTRRGEFDLYREALAEPLGNFGRFERGGGQVRLAVPLPASVHLPEPYFFPLTDGAIDHSAPQTISRRGDFLIVETRAGKGPAPAAIEGVLGLGEGQGLAVTARPGPVPAAGEPVTDDGSEAEGDARSILLAFAGAVIGGLLLNLMPCVFPILSLKALSLARAGESRRAARREALAYAAGAVTACVALGAVLLALRAGGTAAGWAFQLQEPRIILFLLLLVTAIGLNLAGLFELPAVPAEERWTKGSAFGTGALAGFIATPCTGPFMGAALGAALVLPAVAALAVFAGLGLGLALPFLLIGFVPALRRILPRPGPWLVWFRRILAVPMLLTAVYLGWVLERQAGMRGALVLAAALPALAAGLWWGGKRRNWGWFAIPAVVAALAVLVLPPPDAKVAARTDYALAAGPFSEARLNKLRSDGRAVFVYFTADWCVTCKVNEKAVLERPDVARAFAARGVEVLVGDWSRGDADISRFLEKHGRSGVPLYIWYPAMGEPQILPQILTVGTVTGLR